MRRLILLIALLMMVLPLGVVVQAQDEGTVIHTVAAGENLFRIALRYNASLNAIVAENGLGDASLIFVGQQLVIPGATGSPAPAPPPADTSGGDTAPPPPAEGGTYVVQAGDTLGAIARRFNTTVTAIASANNIANINLISVGQQLVVPGATGTAPPPADTSGGDAAPPPPPADSGETVTYTVAPGDTLSGIARRFNTTTTDIATRNGITNPNLISVGQQLVISGSAPAPTQPTDGGTTAPPPPAAPVNNTAPVTGFALGGHVTRGDFPYSDAMRSAGMTWAKMQVRWNRGTPASNFQGYIDAAHGRGFRILLSVVGHHNDIASNPTQYYQDFAGFLGGLAAGGADAIEVWNEPNLPREWPSGLISGGQYTAMLSAAFQTIKANNPNTLVVSAAPSPSGGLPNNPTGGFNDDAFLRSMASAGAANFMDCVGIHYNAGAVPPSATSGAPVGSSGHYSWYYQSMVNLYGGVFGSKPLCFTEIGYLSAEGMPTALPGNFSWAAGNSVQEHAQWIAQAAVMARNSGRVRLFIVWNVDSQVYLPDDPQGGYAIVRPDGTCPACNTLAAAL